MTFTSLLHHQKIKPRLERKYLIQGLSLKSILLLIKLHPASFSVAYPPRKVLNIYFDTLDYCNFHDSVDGLAERVKIRWRWYHTDCPGKKIYLEWKAKNNHYIYKKSQPYQLPKNFSISQLPSLTTTSNLDFFEKEVVKNLKPVLFNAYKRYYFTSQNKKVRLTLDTDLTSKRIYGRCFVLGPQGLRKDRDVCIIEMKYAPENEESVETISKYFPFLLTRQSKYVQGFLNTQY